MECDEEELCETCRRAREGSERRFEQAGRGVVPRESMTRTRDEAKELRSRVEEVEDLRKKEEEERFGKMTENSDDRKGHSRKVAKRVTDERFRWVPVSSLSTAHMTRTNGRTSCA